MKTWQLGNHLLEFIEETHTYVCDGLIVPSVSTILKTKFNDYVGVSKEVLNRAAELGSNLHLAIELFDKGIKEISSPYGNPIKIYCIERTLCDLLRSRKDFNKERYIPAVQKYMRSKQKDLYKIMEYAKLLNVENKIRPYLEVLL